MIIGKNETIQLWNISDEAEKIVGAELTLYKKDVASTYYFDFDHEKASSFMEVLKSFGLIKKSYGDYFVSKSINKNCKAKEMIDKSIHYAFKYKLIESISLMKTKNDDLVLCGSFDENFAKDLNIFLPRSSTKFLDKGVVMLEGDDCVDYLLQANASVYKMNKEFDKNFDK